jgi:hypothetical protein
MFRTAAASRGFSSSQATRPSDDRRALVEALDAWCAADELARMVGVALTGLGRG